MSHPAWVCGLKPTSATGEYLDKGHTLRGCVDWNNADILAKLDEVVTPCVGVWIETDIIDLYGLYCEVTPCVGVWIETKILSFIRITKSVTPCVGVWIET